MSVPAGMRMSGPGAEGALPGSANASTVGIGVVAPAADHWLSSAFSSSDRTPSRKVPAATVLAFGASDGSARWGDVEAETRTASNIGPKRAYRTCALFVEEARY